ncbi:MAG: hypothetical protein HY619_00610 [Thaumarchaeota archaeon]|nr:hypothetical protein [Nitrososphaerota archaeon]
MAPLSPLQIPLNPLDWFNQFSTFIFQLFTSALAGAFELLLNSLGGEQGVYFFLIKLPIGHAAAGDIGPAIVNVLEIIRNVSLIFFAVVFLVAGISYALESFGAMREGTASGILTGSVFTLITIFLALPLYNATASLLNVLTDPGSKLILEPGMIMGVLKATISPPPVNAEQALLNAIMAVFVFIIDMIALIAIAVLGALRIFFVGSLVVMMPLLLILRLIPLTKGVAESLIEMLVGLMLASVIAAIFLRFGFEVIQQWGGLLAMLAAFGTIVAAAMMPTVLAPKLGSLFMTTAGIVTAGAQTGATVAGLAAIGAGTAGVGALQMMGGGSILRGAVASATPKLGSFADRIVGWSSLNLGHLGGLATAATAGVLTTSRIAPPMIKGGLTGLSRGFGRTGLAPGGPFVATLKPPLFKETAKETALGVYSPYALKYAGTTAEALLLQFSNQPVAGENSSEGISWIKQVTEGWSAVTAGQYIRDRTGVGHLDKNYSMVGSEFQKFIKSLEAKPEIASRIRRNLDAWYDSEKSRKANLRPMVENMGFNRLRLEEQLSKKPYNPQLEKLDLGEAFKSMDTTFREVPAPSLHIVKPAEHGAKPTELTDSEARNRLLELDGLSGGRVKKMSSEEYKETIDFLGWRQRALEDKMKNEKLSEDENWQLGLIKKTIERLERKRKSSASLH